jgi:type I restriction enzyme S subunit
MPETQDGPFLVTAANVNGGRIQYETARKTSKSAFDTLLTDKSRPKVNDILLTKDGTLGRVAIVEKENLCINQSVAVLRPNKLVNPIFLKILLESPTYQKLMLDDSRGSAIKHIYITDVDKMKVAFPSLEEQQKIAERLKAIDNKLQTEQTYLQKIQSLKKGLMEDLLSGKKQVKVNEAATV